MSAASIPPEKLALFGALAIGGYWFMTRTASGASLPKLTPAALFNRNSNVSPAQAGQLSPAIYPLANEIGKWFGNVINGGRAPGYTEAMAGAPHASDRDTKPYQPFEANYPSSSTDGYAANPSPAFNSAYDFSNEYWY